MSHVIINSISTPFLDGLLDAYPNANTFYFKDGEYHLVDTLRVNRSGIKFVSLSHNSSLVSIIQDTENKNAFEVSNNNVTFSHLSISVKGTCACINFVDCNWTNTRNCRFYGDQDYAISYIVSTNTDPEIDIFNNGGFSTNNNFDDNIVYTPSVGNAALFSLQKNCSVRNNIIRGGKIFVNLSADSAVNNNYVLDSVVHGIQCSLPCSDLQINNNVISQSTNASVNLNLSEAYSLHKDANVNISVNNNTIKNSNFIAVEINNAKNVDIRNNKIKWIQEHGVYLVKSENIIVHDNNIVKTSRGITVDVDTNNCTIDNNTVYSIVPFMSMNGIFCEANTSGNSVNNNIIKGQYSGDAFSDLSISNTSSNNSIIKHVTFSEEILNLIE